MDPKNAQPVLPEVFESIQNLDVDKLFHFSKEALRPVLPYLVRMSLCANLDTSEKWANKKMKISKCLSGIEVVNNLVGLLSIAFDALEQDARKEQLLRAKSGSTQAENEVILQLEHGLALEFERSDADRKLSLLLSELLFIISRMKEPSSEFYMKSSELFESDIYLEEVSDVLCIAQAELPGLLTVCEVAEALLHIENGPWLLCRLVANNPDCFLEVCHSLVSNGEKQDTDGLGNKQRCKALTLLCNMCATSALTVRQFCIEQCRMPGLALSLTLAHSPAASSTETSDAQSRGSVSDVVSFVLGVLLGSDTNIRTWFAQFINTDQKKSTKSAVYSMRQEVLSQLKTILPSEEEDGGGGQICEHHLLQCCAIIRFYCALKTIATIKLNEEETRAILNVIVSQPPSISDSTAVHFICLSLCMLLACSYVISTLDDEVRVVSWIRRLLTEGIKYERSAGVSASFSEMLLLIAIHFHSNQNAAIADLVSATLGMKSLVKANQLTKLKQMFTQEIFTEQVVAAHAVRVAVTKNLNADIVGYLPVHCIYQLLKSRAFSKHKVPIKDWIFRQICQCATPVHPLMPPLIETYVSSVVVPNAKTDRMNEPIAEDEILEVFSDSVLAKQKLPELHASSLVGMISSNFTAQLLLLYYVLLFEDTLLSNNAKFGVTSHSKIESYSSELFSQIPMKYILQQAQQQQRLYAGIYAPLLRLLVAHYPQLCLVEDWLDGEVRQPLLRLSALTLPALPCTVEGLQKAFDKLPSDSTEATLLLQQLSVAEPKHLTPFLEVIVESLPKLLEAEIPRKLLELVKRVWLSLNTMMPRKLRIMTANALHPVERQSAFKAVDPYSELDLMLDPLLVLRCDERIYRCAPILEIVLRILDSYLHASRLHLSLQLQINPPIDRQIGQLTSNVQQEREELKSALIMAQESAAVQLLLEACLPRANQQGESTSCLREIQCLICSRLHQWFIANTQLAKLVHFQGYPSELLPVTVSNIPSMHICLDFIPELISQPSPEKQIFAIQLTSYLSLQYALPKSMSVSKLAINVMSTLLTVLSRDQRPDFFIPTLPSLVRITSAFPPLYSDVILLVMHLGRVCSANLANLDNVIAADLLVQSVSCMEIVEEQNLSRLDASLCTKYAILSTTIQKTFREIVQTTATLRHHLVD